MQEPDESSGVCLNHQSNPVLTQANSVIPTRPAELLKMGYCADVRSLLDCPDQFGNPVAEVFILDGAEILRKAAVE